MKKIFTLVFVLFAFMAANAQQILFADFESATLPTGWTVIDSDGDGYNWEISQTDRTHGSYCIASASYDNNNGALNPDNWLITPALNLSSDATLTFWVVGQDASWAAENYSVYVATSPTVAAFTATTPVLANQTSTATLTQITVNLSAYTGQTVYIGFRHHNITDMFRLNIDDIEVSANPTVPTIVANPASITFPATAIGNTRDGNVTVTTYLLTSDVTATASGPFTISNNGVNYAATTTIDSTGGTLYVRYTPAVAGAETGTIQLASTGATASVTLAGTALDCSQAQSTLPWTEDFSGDVFPPLCWDMNCTVCDTTWNVYTYSGVNWASCSGSIQTQNEQLITKTFDFTNYTHTILLDFSFMCNYSYVLDGTVDLKIYASTDGGSTFSATPVWSMSQYGEFSTWTPTLATVNLSSLAGQSNVVLKFVKEGTLCQVLFAELEMYAYDNPIIVVNENEFSFYTEANTNDDVVTVVNGYNLTDPITATTAAPYAVSADGNTYGTTATLTGNQLYIRYAPTAAGVNSGVVTLASTGATNVTLSLEGEAYDCSNITLPYVQDFNKGGNIPGCISLDYACGDPTINPITMISVDGESDYCLRFSSYNRVESGDYGQYLITPQLPNTSGLAVSFDWMSYYGAENLSVGYSLTDNNLNSFVWLPEEELESTTEDFDTYTTNIPAGARYVALFYNSNYKYYLYVDNLTINGTLVGVDEHTASASIYPNPANTVLNITATSNINTVEVFNVMGQQVAAYDANDVNTQINTSSLANGVYTVRINTENGVVNQKFTVAR